MSLVQRAKSFVTGALPLRDQDYLVRKIKIRLPGDHMLPIFQAAHPLYDRFLPHLAKQLPSQSTVIDVGANCGDTVATMAGANPNLNYICIEPDQRFFGYLLDNILRIESRYPAASIQPIKALVGKAVQSASLIEGAHGSTRTADVRGGDIKSATLDALLLDAGPSVSLIKTDVDGYDYDVIASAERTIAANAPILFFELYYTSEEQLRAFAAMLSSLEQGGYQFQALDNFGLPMLHGSAALVMQLADYVQAQNKGLSTRTIYYLDVLAWTGRDADIIKSAMNRYLAV